MSDVNKRKLVVAVSDNLGLPQIEVKIIFETLVIAIRRYLEQGRAIEIRGFGSFYTKNRKPRVGLNPWTGEQISIPARIRPVFKASRDLRARVNGNGI